MSRPNPFIVRVFKSQNMRRLHFLLSGVLCFIGVLSHAQTGSEGYFRAGEKLYQSGHYEDAAQYFERYLTAGKGGRSRGVPMSVQKKVRGARERDPRQVAVYLLGDCYRCEHDYVRSEVYCQKACADPQ